MPPSLWVASSPQELLCTFTDNESFLFSGFKQTTMRLPPGKSHVLHYGLMPIAAGHVRVPPLQVLVRPPGGEGGMELIDNSKARIVFVEPCAASHGAIA